MFSCVIEKEKRNSTAQRDDNCCSILVNEVAARLGNLATFSGPPTGRFVRPTQGYRFAWRTLRGCVIADINDGIEFLLSLDTHTPLRETSG